MTSAPDKEHLELEVADPVGARTSLAEAYLRAGRFAEAKQQALQALETAPSYLRAQQALLRSIEDPPSP